MRRQWVGGRKNNSRFRVTGSEGAQPWRQEVGEKPRYGLPEHLPYRIYGYRNLVTTGDRAMSGNYETGLKLFDPIQ